jgi:NADPH:quinone reductase-like Zn-dependent oxidoreductase
MRVLVTREPHRRDRRRPNPARRRSAVFAAAAQPDAVPQIAAAIVVQEVTVPIAATFPIEQINEAATLQAARHVHGKIVVTL